ncbi:MAG: aspartate--tRNA ligase, partial [Candidatus Binatia bacterium]
MESGRTILSESLGDWRRTNGCGDLRANDVGRTVTMMGWVHVRRDHGGLIFVDLRDRSGLVQLVFNPAVDSGAHRRAEDLRMEYVVAARGEVVHRPPETVNADMPTGEIEVVVREIRLLNDARPLPFPVDDGVEVAENTRLRYRYLDLRRPRMAANFALRHRLAKTIRDYFDARGFLEVETPVLTRSTPEGARDYLVPSRVNPGRFYALPQSPQLFKQLLMVAGIDRYYQIARCLRDEDFRAERQYEFMQLDAEMSFVDQDDVLAAISEAVLDAAEAAVGEQPEIERMTWHDAMDRFGVDKPDLRFGMELVDVGP